MSPQRKVRGAKQFSRPTDCSKILQSPDKFTKFC